MAIKNKESVSIPNNAVSNAIETDIQDKDFLDSLAALQQGPLDIGDKGGKGAAKKSFDVTSPNTIFVRGLPYTATDKDLEKFFEEVGPLRQCFVVKQPKTEDSSVELNRGYGYVHYALKEDAEKAIASLTKIKFMGRFLNLEFANRRPSKKERSEVAPSANNKVAKTSRSNPKPKSNEIEEDRTVVVSNIPRSMGKVRLQKFLEELDIKPMSIFFKTGLARAVYETVELAQLATARVQNKKADGQPLHATLLTNLLLKTKHARLIIRNIPFKLREHELEKLFDQFGPVIEVKMPRKLDGSKKLLGFGFIQYIDIETAEKAMKALNGSEHYERPIVVDFCVSRAKFSDPNKSGMEDKPAASSDDSSKSDQQAENSSEDESGSEDLIVNRTEDEPFQNALFEDGEPDDIMDSEDSESEDDASSENGALDHDSDSKDKLDEGKSSMKLRVPPECTLFVRNICFETTDQDLFEKFSGFGKLRYARVVYDKVTLRSKGTAFISFVKPADARNCLELASQLNWNEESKKLASSKSILVPEGPRSLAERFTLHDRLLLLSPSVSKDKAEELSGPARTTPKEDKRNFYLIREGVIFPNSPVGKMLDYKEVERRLASYNFRRKQLDSNPSLFVSKTRISVRNLPLDVDDKALKTLAIRAFSLFKQEVKDGVRQPLTPKEREEGWDKKLRIVQAKIVRSKDKVDSSTGLTKSSGFGFIEIQHHSHALAILRYLNCNPNVFPKLSKVTENTKPVLNINSKVDSSKEPQPETRVRGQLLTVEFAIENKLILKRREERLNYKQRVQSQIENGSQDKGKRPREDKPVARGSKRGKFESKDKKRSGMNFHRRKH